MKKLVIAALSALLSVTAAQADTVSYSDTVDTTALNWTDSFSLSLFDASLGTLNSVTYTLTSTLTNQVIVYSSSSSTSVWAYSAGGTGAQLQYGTLEVGFECGKDLAVSSSSSPATYSGTCIGEESVVYSTADGLDLSSWIGSGSFNIDVSSVLVDWGLDTNSLQADFTALANATLTITYDYTPSSVPEPGALALAGLALAGAGVSLRRRRA